MEAEDKVLNSEVFGSVELQEGERLELIRFGDLKEGDVLVGSQGRTTVTQGFDEHVPESMYLIETDSGIELEVSGNHLFYVVTASDRDLHRERLAEGKRLGKLISTESIRELQSLAQSEDGRFGFIAEFEDFIFPKSDELRKVLIRIGESLGPVAESNLFVDDLGGAEAPLFHGTILNYDRRAFAQQILSVLNIGKARKIWPPIVGTVMTAEELVSHDPEDIYIPDPPKVQEENR